MYFFSKSDKSFLWEDFIKIRIVVFKRKSIVQVSCKLHSILQKPSTEIDLVFETFGDNQFCSQLNYWII